jgi:RNA polymerase sigma-70 factor (ECF subfamily)
VAMMKIIDAEKERILLGRIALKDEKSFSDLYDRYSRIIFSLALKIVKNRQDAEEILQNVFLQVWDKAASFDNNKGNVYAWIITMTRNKSIDKIRSKDYKTENQNIALNEKLAYNLKFFGNLTLDASTASDRTDFVKNALSSLSDEHKIIIDLAFFNGLTQSEISEELKIPLGTVKTRMRQAMIKLKNLLSDYF